MKPRSVLSWLATTFGGMVATPFLQAPATKLAEALHFDTTLSDRWGPLVQWLSDLAQNPWYIAFAGFAVGTASGMWIDTALRSREGRSNPNFKLLDLTQKSYNGITINVQGLLTRLINEQNLGALSGKIFIGCKFVGPAFLMFDGTTSLDGNLKWNNMGSPAKIMGGETVVGALVLLNCMISDCEFDNIQPLLTDETYDTFRKAAEAILPPQRVRVSPVNPLAAP